MLPFEIACTADLVDHQFIKGVLELRKAGTIEPR